MKKTVKVDGWVGGRQAGRQGGSEEGRKHRRSLMQMDGRRAGREVLDACGISDRGTAREHSL